jgi:hypothetical protein
MTTPWETSMALVFTYSWVAIDLVSTDPVRRISEKLVGLCLSRLRTSPSRGAPSHPAPALTGVIFLRPPPLGGGRVYASGEIAFGAAPKYQWHRKGMTRDSGVSFLCGVEAESPTMMLLLLPLFPCLF